ncbi:MAG: MogA/MoaB family molybdenum cofactor biosynthesis protein [Verrucomicrobiae bacterium]|nr:MogA/MoaB family molybdenum cofactor biosynthesis protein [Verrucomicrobiae bacterium]
MRVAILTISDSAASGKREDLSGPALESRVKELNLLVVDRTAVADDEQAIARQLSEWADGAVASVILTSGGTGVAARDVTPEATRSVIDREIPGVAELMRSKGLEQTRMSVLSRAVAGTRKRSFIVNLPGSPRGAVHSLNAIAPLIPHIIELLEGHTAHEPHSNEKLESGC